MDVASVEELGELVADAEEAVDEAVDEAEGVAEGELERTMVA